MSECSMRSGDTSTVDSRYIFMKNGQVEQTCKEDKEKEKDDNSRDTQAHQDTGSMTRRP
jgi:hypothetical protein